MSEKYLISIAIGPVQDFIASARRSRDLWFGSWLLSELSKVVAETIGEKNLIFPSSLNGNVVNKILAIVEISDKNQLDTKLKDAIKLRLEGIYNPIFNKIENELNKKEKIFYREESEEQIKDLTELYWAAVPYEKSKDNYKICRERVEILLNARKATRDFNQVTPINSAKENAWGSNAPKSSLDGQRESVILDREIDKPTIQRVFNLRKAERLCGVGVLKRLTEKKSFASTSHVASLPLLDSLKDKNIDDFDYLRKLTDIIGGIDENEFKNIVGKTPLSHTFFLNYDGHLLFENRLKDFFVEPELTEAKNALKRFLKAAFPNETKNPLPYFGLLQADGDRMGTVIDNQDTPKKHKDLSEALSKFANDVKDIVENYNGCLIYSGGDDVLAMLPLHTVLKCTRDLAEKFESSLKKFEFTKDGETIKPTLSAGIAIVHHTEPLQESLETMRRAEKEAKSVKGKNALAIILSKRSGADTTIKGSWKDDRETDKSFDERLKWFIYLHLAELFPSGVAYELRDLWLRFKDETDSKGKIKQGFDEIVRKEAFRIINRKKTVAGKKNVSDEVLTKLKDFIEESNISIESLAKEIIVAKEFAKAYNQSGMTAKKFAKESNLQEGGNDNDE